MDGARFLDSHHSRKRRLLLSAFSSTQRSRVVVVPDQSLGRYIRFSDIRWPAACPFRLDVITEKKKKKSLLFFCDDSAPFSLPFGRLVLLERWPSLNFLIERQRGSRHFADDERQRRKLGSIYTFRCRLRAPLLVSLNAHVHVLLFFSLGSFPPLPFCFNLHFPFSATVPVVGLLLCVCVLASSPTCCPHRTALN